MKNMIAALAVGMSLAAPFAWADATRCGCSDKCMTQCQKGDPHRNCTCKSCDCNKSGKCSHDQCHKDPKE